MYKSRKEIALHITKVYVFEKKNLGQKNNGKQQDEAQQRVNIHDIVTGISYRQLEKEEVNEEFRTQITSLEWRQNIFVGFINSDQSSP